MTTQQKGVHYRVGGKIEYSGVEILPQGKDIECIVISKIIFHPELKVAGSTNKKVWVAHFAPNPYTDRPMILNSTNRSTLNALFNPEFGYLNLLTNIPVRLTQAPTKNVKDGTQTMGLRISKTPATTTPKKKPELTPTHTHWSKAVDYVKDGKDRAFLEAHFTISNPIWEQLLKLKQNEQQD